MSAIMISDITVLSEEAFQAYRAHAAKVIGQFGGRYLARNGEVRLLEGQWQPRAVVVVEFPSLEQAEAWYRRIHEFGGPEVLQIETAMVDSHPQISCVSPSG